MTDRHDDLDVVERLRSELSEARRQNEELRAQLAQFSPHVSTLELTLQSTTDPSYYRLKAEWNRPDDPVACERLIQLDETALLEASLEPERYGSLLGQALFDENVRDLFVLARGDDRPLRILLAVESERLQRLRWERLCGPFDGTNWRPLRPNQRTPFSLFIPTLTERRYPPFHQDELNALVVIASPEAQHSRVAPFDEESALRTVLDGLGDIPCRVLTNIEPGKYPQIVGRPSLAAICGQLANGEHGPFTLLHMVCHGAFLRTRNDSVLFLHGDDTLPGDVDREGRTATVPTSTFITRLQQLGKERGLPHFAFLSVCDSAVQGPPVNPTDEALTPLTDWRDTIRGLGQRLVRDVGMKAVVAMTDKISQVTALTLGRAFYPALRRHGEVDVALAEACIAVAGRGDLTTPALFARVVGKRLFTHASNRRPLDEQEIVVGLAGLRTMFEERAPVTLVRLDELASRLRTDDIDRAALDELERLCEAVIELSFTQFARGAKPPRYARECPFPGLRAFTSEQRRYFCGRQPLVNTLVEHLHRQSFVCVLGSSGSGKSSLVAAGVIPALAEKQRGLVVARMTPGSDPPGNLREARGRLGDAPETLLFIDQFEELFTLCVDKAARKQFLDEILEMARPERQVIMTMRADFLGECAAHPGLRRAVQRQPELVPPMTPEELRGAIEEQAKEAGLRFETGLTEWILPELIREPGAMPLLQHALAELWERRVGRWLRRSAWTDEIGGVAGAIKKTAEGVWESLDDDDRRLLPGIMMKLTRVGGDEVGPQRDTRQRVAIDRLVPATAGDEERQRVRNLVARLAGDGARLLVTGHDAQQDWDAVEVAHEALLSHWPRLHAWINEAREMLLLQQDLRSAAQQWIRDGKRIWIGSGASDRHVSAWLEHRGARAEAVRVMMKDRGLELDEQEIRATRSPGEAPGTGSVKEYFAACVAADEEEAGQQRAYQAALEAALRDAQIGLRREQKRLLDETGWAVVFTRNAPPAIRQALAPLLALRKQQAGGRYREFEVHPRQNFKQFLKRCGVGFATLNVDVVPYYLLLVGGPDEISFELQFQLSTMYAVGRIAFTTAEEYAAYARGVVAAETELPHRPRTVGVVGVQYENDLASDIFASKLTGPLLAHLQKRSSGWEVRDHSGDTSRMGLLALLGGARTPTFLFGGSYGMRPQDGDPLRLLTTGALVTGDRPGPVFKPEGDMPSAEELLRAEDIPDDACLSGSIIFWWGSYVAGVARFVSGENTKPSPDVTGEPFVARLPQRLLGHPNGGALAMIGPLTLGWLQDISDQNLSEIDFVGHLLDGHTVGSAMETMFRRYAVRASVLSDMSMSTGVAEADRLNAKIAAHGARAWALLGDPAVYLPVAPRVSLGPEDPG